MALWGSQTGGGAISDALRKAVYDIDDDNIVDNSEALGGQLPAFYLDRANHSNSQPATTVDFNNIASGLLANTVQAGIDELASKVSDIETGTILAGDSSLLNGQADTYYLDRANHTGVQDALTITYDNTVSSLVAIDAQAAIDELDALNDDILNGAISVGDSDLLESQNGAYYLDRTNHTNTQPASTIEYDNVASGMVAITVQLGIDELDTEIDNIKLGTTQVGDSAKLASQIPSYYLDRTNHTGTDEATEVTFDNTLSGLLAVTVQVAIIELEGLINTHTHVKSEITDFVEGDYVHVSGNESISGEKTFQNNVIFAQDVTFQGTVTEVLSDDLVVKDNNIVLNAGETGGGISAVTSGITIDRGTFTDASIIFDDVSDKWLFGLVGSEVPVGDMEKSTYDGDNSGQVDKSDDSDLLGGQNSAYHLDRTNHTNTQAGNTVDFNNVASGYVATNVQTVLDEIIVRKMEFSVYDPLQTGQVQGSDLADNSIMLGGQIASYYLDRANHTGFDNASQITYNPTGSNLISTLVQDAIDELDTAKMSILTYDPSMTGQVQNADFADNSDKLNGEIASFYTNRSNHTGTQLAVTVEFIPGVSGIVATEVQAAILELKSDIVTLSGTAGNMSKVVYDTNDNGKVDGAELADNSAMLGNELPAYYLDLANHIGNVAGANVTFDPLPIGYAAINVQDAIVEADIKIESEITARTNAIANIISGVQSVGTADKLGGQLGTFYLNKDNHTGDDNAIEVLFDNGTSSLVATEVQSAILELESLIGGVAGGDMTKAIYDVNDNGIVDNAESSNDSSLLEGSDSAYHLDRANHTGTQLATTIVYDPTGTSLIATLAQTAITELDTNVTTEKNRINDIISGVQVVGDTDKFENEDGLFYLNRNNHVGTINGIDVAFDNNLSNLVATEIQSAIIELETLVANAAGDMVKATYDVLSTGIVDDAEKLGGQLPAYYLDLANVTGALPAVDVSFNNTISGITSASNVQEAIDFIDDELDKIKDGTQSIGNSDLLEGQNGSYYLNYDNTISGLTASTIKLALDELATLVGSSTLADLTDTNITTPADLEVLSYDFASSKWINSPAPSGLPTGTTASQPLAYSGAGNVWNPVNSITFNTGNINIGASGGSVGKLNLIHSNGLATKLEATNVSGTAILANPAGNYVIPTLPTAIACKQYVDDEIAAIPAGSGGGGTYIKVRGLIDYTLEGLYAPATTWDGTKYTIPFYGGTALQTQDGLAIANGETVLHLDPLNPERNGVYIWNNSTFTLERIAEYNEVAEINKADLIYIEEGNLASKSLYANASTIATLNTDPIVFEKISESEFYSITQTIVDGGTHVIDDEIAVLGEISVWVQNESRKKCEVLYESGIAPDIIALNTIGTNFYTATELNPGTMNIYDSGTNSLAIKNLTGGDVTLEIRIKK